MKKTIAIALAAALSPFAAPAAMAELSAFKVQGETVTLAEQRVVYEDLVAHGAKAGPALEADVRRRAALLRVMAREGKERGLESDTATRIRIGVAYRSVLAKAAEKDWMDRHQATDKEVESEYARQKAAYGDLEYRLREIVVADEASAKAAIHDLARGRKFEDLARERSIDRRTGHLGGLTGWIPSSRMPPAVAKAVKGLSEGDTAMTPAKGRNGWHVVRLEGKRKAEGFPDLMSSRESIRKALTAVAARRHFESLANAGGKSTKPQ